MKSRALREHSKKIGLAAALFGASALIAGILLGSGILMGIGGVTLFLAAYAIAFAQVGSL